MTQSERVLAALRKGPVNTVHFAQIPVIDGGKPILRIAARVFDLQQQGYLITTRRRSNATVDYVLVGDVDRSDGLTAQATVETKAAEPRSDIGPSTIASACATDGVDESGVAPPAPSEVTSDSLFDDGDYASRSDYRDAEAA